MGSSGDGGPASSAALNFPQGLAVDSTGNLYMTDAGNNKVRMITRSTGIITTVAGTGMIGSSGDGGPAKSATFNKALDVAVDSSGNIFIADAMIGQVYYGKVRLVTKATGIITTYAGTGEYGYNGDGIAASSAQLKYPVAVAVDSSDNLYIGDSYNYRVRLVTRSTGIITTIAGTGTAGTAGNNGPATMADLWNPYSLAVDSSGSIIIVDASVIRLVTRSTGDITHFAGMNYISQSSEGDGGDARFAYWGYVYAAAMDASGNVYLCDGMDSNVRLVTRGSNIITTFAGKPGGRMGQGGTTGDGGPATSALLQFPNGIAIDSSGNVFISDGNGYNIREVVSHVMPSSQPTVLPSQQPSRQPSTRPTKFNIGPRNPTSQPTTRPTRLVMSPPSAALRAVRLCVFVCTPFRAVVTLRLPLLLPFTDSVLSSPHIASSPLRPSVTPRAPSSPSRARERQGTPATPTRPPALR